jgi:hypothetical protein
MVVTSALRSPGGIGALDKVTNEPQYAPPNRLSRPASSVES